MNVIRLAMFLTTGLILTGAASAKAETTAAQRAQIEAARNLVDELGAQQTPDTVFQFNTGLDKPKDLAGSLSNYLSPEAREIADVDLESFHQAQLENAEIKLNQQFEEKGRIRREQTQKIDQKHKRYEQLEADISANQAQAQKRLDAALEQKAQRQGKASAKLDAEIKQQSRRVNSATVKKQQISIKKAELGKSRSTAKYLKMRQEIAATKNKLAAMKTAMQRKAKFDKGSAILGVVLTAISSEMEENALAQQEGRQPLAANKVVNFAKNISGYSTIKGVMDNVEMAKMEAMVSTMEFFEANGFDLNDPATQELAMKRAEDAARRAVARTAIYEGAKLAPVVSDLISIKEGFDAAGEAYVAVEEAAYITASNEEAQFQTSLRGAVKIEAKVRQMEAIAERSKLLIASLDKLKGQLLVLEQGAEANRDKVRQAVSLLETYNEQAEVLSNPTVAADFQPASIEALLGRLKAVKASADEQTGNMQRVKSEHQSGQLTAQGVATQAKFIGDLLQPAIADHAALQPALSRVENIGRSNELAAQVPATLEFLRQAKAVMQQQGDRSNQLYEIYREQAGTLEQLARQFQELRGEMPKYLAYVQSSKNLEDPHQDKIRAALDRANNVDIDQTALRRVIDDARGLRNSAGLAGALADLDKPPKIIDTSTVNALVQQAQQAWAQLAGPNQAAAESLQNAQSLLNQLVALAGDAKPTVVADNVKPSVKTDLTLQGKLFAGKSHLKLTPDDIRDTLLNGSRNKTYHSKDFFGFKAYDFPPNVKPWEFCKQVTDDYCPGDNKLYRILETGETVRNWQDEKIKAPYWIAYQLRDFDATLNFSPRWVRNLKEELFLTSDIKNAEHHKDETDVIPISLPHADEALVYTRGDSGIKTVNLLARKDQLVIRANGKVECWVGPVENENEKRLLHATNVINSDAWALDQFGKELFTRCADWQGQQEEILTTLLDPLLAEATPLIQKIGNNLYFQPIDFDLSFKDLVGDERNNTYRELNEKHSSTSRFSRNWQVSAGKRRDDFFERYSFQVSWDNDVHYSETLQDIFDKIDHSIDKSVSDYLKHPSIERREFKVNLPGTDLAKLVRSNHLWTVKSTDFRAAQISEYLYFRIDNIWAKVECSATLPVDRQDTRTVEIAKAIIAKIRKAPKGW